ncbi:MAG: hypothetical protein DRN04_18125 [Thermoprotei archaeon]|nr:MAG: hypothetical protein DRN04_18125 [Thermoprotei archaeon]
MHKRPNIVVIVMDALRSQNLTIYGYSKPTCPFMSKLASKGVVFENFYSTTDQTDPSFTTIFSGRHPLVHGIVRHGHNVTKGMVSTFFSTGTMLISEILSRNGYVTVGLDWLSRWHKVGYKYYGSIVDLSKIFRKRAFLARMRPVRLHRKLVEFIASIPYRSVYEKIASGIIKISYFYDKDAFNCFHIAKEIIKEIGKPFFLMIHLWDTHTPYTNIPKYIVKEFYEEPNGEKIEEMVKRIKNTTWRNLVLRVHLRGIKYVSEIEAKYNAAIKYVDEKLREFYEFLEEIDIVNDTYIIITSDHGDNLVRNGIYIGHGGLFQRVIKVPLIIVGPKIPSGKRIKPYAQHIDLFTTILSLANIKHPKNYYVSGKNLLKAIETEEEIHDYLLVVSSTAPERYALIKDNYKYVYSPTKEKAMDKYGGIWFQSVKELYDLRKDADDRENLVHTSPDLALEMERRLMRAVREMIKTRLKLIIKHKVKHLI